MPAQRSPGGYRLYDEEAVDRLAFIGAARHDSIPLEEIRKLLTVWESGLCVQVQERLSPLLRDGLGSATRRSAELEAFVVRLRRALELRGSRCVAVGAIRRAGSSYPRASRHRRVAARTH